MTKTTIELLREAREWLSVEEHWCAVDRWHPNGIANCAIGALERAAGATDAMSDWSLNRVICDSIKVLAKAIQGIRSGSFADVFAPALTVSFFNDREGWGRTREVFDLAIKLEQEEIDRQVKELVESSEAVPILVG